MSTSFIIQAKRIFLRPLQPDDVGETYLSWFADATYIASASSMRTIDDLRDYVTQRQDKLNVLFLGIFSREDGKHVGNIKYEPIDERTQTAVCGILIGEPSARGKGIAGEAINASAEWLKAMRGIRHVALGVNDANEAAVRAYSKLGFRQAKSPHIHKAPGVIAMVWDI